AATNRDLKAMVAEGTFRGDLYYRLLVAPVAIPPLRTRPEDILPLATHWLGRISPQHGGRVTGFTPEAEQRLLTYDGRGKVRERGNLVGRLVLLGRGERTGGAQPPLDFSPAPLASPSDASFVYEMETARAGGDAVEQPAVTADADAPTSLHEVGHAHIRMVLEKMKGNKTKAAEALGISRQTLRSRLSSLR